MTIVACLSWYKEPLPFLDRCVRSLAGLADVIVAVDGAWALFPDGDAWSASEQADVIESAAQDSGIHPFVTGGKVWESQVEKRGFLMELAGALGDWLFVIDGDEHVTECHPLVVEQMLELTENDVATVTCRHLDDATHQAPIRRFYRAGVTVEHAHNGYRTADGRWLHGDPCRVELEPTIHLPILLQHDARNRGERRNKDAAAYRANRRAGMVETWPARSASLA